MNPVVLEPGTGACYSDARTRKRGQRWLSWLRAQDYPQDSGGRFFEIATLLPLATSSMLDLRSRPASEWRDSRYIPITTSEGVKTAIPNLWRYPAPGSIARFLRLPLDLNVPASNAIEGFPASVTLLEYLQAIEATLPGRFGSLPICIARGAFQAAMPTYIDLRGMNVPRFTSPRQPAAEVSADVRDLARKYATARRRPTWENLEGLRRTEAQVLFKRTTMSSADLMAIDGINLIYSRNLNFRTAERMTRAFLATLASFQSGLLKIRLGGPEKASESIHKALHSAAAGKFPQRRKASPRPYALVHPNAYFDLYGLLDPPPQEITRLDEAALRIIAAILMFCGRRACCVVDLTLGDFRFAVDPRTGRLHVDLIIRFTKSPRETKMRLPLSLLWPDVELRHLETFLKETQRLFGASWRSRTLLSLVTDIIISKTNADDCANVLRYILTESENQSLHLPRITFATWWIIRVICVRHPGLLEEPLLAPVADNIWFGKEMLEKTSELVGDESVDSLEVGRRILGHASTYEFISSYCRSWPFLLELLARLEMRTR